MAINSYRRITITKILGTSLSFPIPFNGDYVVYDINELTTTINEAGLNLPDPISAENGSSFILKNISNVTIKIYDYLQTTVILEMPTGTAYEFYVTSNSNRQWGFVQLVGDPRPIITSFTIQDPRTNGKLIIQNGTVTPDTADPVNISMPDSLANLSTSTYPGFVYSRYASGIQTLVPLSFSSDSNITIATSFDTGSCTFSLNKTLESLTSFSTYGTKIEGNLISATTGDLYLTSVTSQTTPTFIHLNPITIDSSGNVLNVNNMTVNGSLTYNAQNITSAISLSGTTTADLLIRSETGFEINVNGIDFDKDQNITNVQSISSPKLPTPEPIKINTISIDQLGNISNILSLSSASPTPVNINGLLVKAPTTGVPWVIINPNPATPNQIIDISAPGNVRLNGVTIDSNQNITNVTNLTITGQLVAPNFGMGGITFDNDTVTSTAGSSLTLVSDQKVIVNGVSFDKNQNITNVSSIGSPVSGTLQLNGLYVAASVSSITPPYIHLSPVSTDHEIKIDSTAGVIVNGVTFDSDENLNNVSGIKSGTTGLVDFNGLYVLTGATTITLGTGSEDLPLTIDVPAKVLINDIIFDQHQSISSVSSLNGMTTSDLSITSLGTHSLNLNGIGISQAQAISNVTSITAPSTPSDEGVDFNGLSITNFKATSSQLTPYVVLTTQSITQEMHINSVAKAIVNGISFDSSKNISEVNSLNGLSIANSGVTIPSAININPVEATRNLTLASSAGVFVNGVKFDLEQNITNVKSINGNITISGNLTVNGTTTIGSGSTAIDAGMIPKAWCKFSVQYISATNSYVVSLLGSAGIASVTAPTLGTYKITLTNQMKNGNYAVFPSLMKTNVSNFTTQIVVTSQETTDFSIQCLDPQNNLVQPVEAIYLMVMGDAL